MWLILCFGFIVLMATCHSLTLGVIYGISGWVCYMKHLYEKGKKGQLMRKFIAFCLVMVMLFCLCACGHKADMTDDERSSFQFFCNKMKDPTSIILYGDIIAIKTEKGATIQFQYNAKNGYGGYVGNTMGQVHMVAGDMLFLDEEDADFVDISDLQSRLMLKSWINTMLRYISLAEKMSPMSLALNGCH